MSLSVVRTRLFEAGLAPLAALVAVAMLAPGATALVPASSASAPAAPPPAPTLTATTVVDEELAAPVVASVEDLEAEAIALADEFGAVPVDESGVLCPVADLEVVWEEPSGYTHGAFVAPVGPAPVHGTTDVNGVVVCGDSTWAFMGFEASAEGASWTVLAVPYVNEEDERPEALNLDADVDAHDHAHDDAEAEPAPAEPGPSPSPKATVDTSAWLAGLGPIEPYAAYEPQSSCSPTAKAGTVTMKDALLSSYPATRNLGIARACHLGGRSEHKEGRAFDWGAYVTRPAERGSVEQFLTQLLATDADGNRHALARRMGVMYVIWNGQIWSAYRPQDGWRRYGGPNPHTDHAHVSLSYAGGAGRTSFFTQNLAAKGIFSQVPPGASAINTAAVVAAPSRPPAATSVAARPSESTRPREEAARTGWRQTSASGEQVSHVERQAARERRQAAEAERRAAWEAARQAGEAERQQRAAERQARREAAEAQRQAEVQRRREAEEARHAERQARREAGEAQRQAELQRRREAEEARRAERQAQREAAEAARQAELQRRREAEEARRAERQRQREAAEAARRARRRPAPSPSPTTSPTPTPAPAVSEPAPVVSEPAPTESG